MSLISEYNVSRADSPVNIFETLLLFPILMLQRIYKISLPQIPEEKLLFICNGI